MNTSGRCSVTRVLHIAVIAATLSLLPQVAAAFQNQEEALEYYRKVTESVPGAVSWQTLAETEVTHTSPAPLQTIITVNFTPTIEALDGRNVKIKGFIYPLEPGETHSRFLLSAYPPGCPFCLPAGPRELVEVLAAVPVRFTQDAVLVEGTFHLLHDDPTGIYYRLTEAQEGEG
jgi:hypothetical protein